MLVAAALAAALGTGAEPARYRHRRHGRAPQARERVVVPPVPEVEPGLPPYPAPSIIILRVRKDFSTFDERWRAQWGVD